MIVTEAEPLVDYILTISAKVESKMVQDITEHIKGILSEKGSIEITKEAGMFIASQHD